ncbi:MAG: hypothetical protein QE269_05050 [Fimbriimonas sp.]|jgi:hypothetical protein|nr:hypothetical protein [Fimbriimonas sp.]
MSLLAQKLTQRVFTVKRSLLKLIGAEYFVYDEANNLLFLAHQEGFKWKLAIDVYADQAKTQSLMSIRARQIVDFSAAYDIWDNTTNQGIGILQRKGWSSMVRDEWIICDPSGVQVATLIEDSMLLSILRRFADGLIPQNYDILINGQRVVDLRQNFNPFNYHLRCEVQGMIDNRLVLASAILLAAVEGKQRG